MSVPCSTRLLVNPKIEEIPAEATHRIAMTCAPGPSPASFASMHAHSTLRLDRAIRAYQIESTTQQSDPRYAEARAEKAQALNEAGMWHDILTNPNRARITGW